MTTHTKVYDVSIRRDVTQEALVRVYCEIEEGAPLPTKQSIMDDARELADDGDFFNIINKHTTYVHKLEGEFNDICR